MSANAPTSDALDFDLLIAPDSSGGYRVRLLSSPAGSATGSFTPPFSDLEIENLVLRMGQVRTGLRRRESPQTEAAREFGQRLFGAVFDGELGSCWQSSAAEAARQGKRLRLRLRLSDTPELLDLPWEYLYDSAADRFVALSSKTPVVRFLDLPGQIAPRPVRGALRILALIASPQDVATLDVEHEWSNLQTALADLAEQGRVQIDRCPQPTLPELQRTLRRQEYHIFHFVGHGGYDSRAGDGVLLFEDEQRRSRPVSGRQLGALLHDEGQLRLSVLNACEGARTSRTDPFAGVGQSLLQQGVPAVIAMQFAITDAAASTFAREFYAAVADGYPVDRALAEARKAMFAASDSVEWGTPVLYLRPVEGSIFNLVAPARQSQVQVPAPPPAPATATISGAAVPAAAAPAASSSVARGEQNTTFPAAAAVSAPGAQTSPPARERRRSWSIIGLLIALLLVAAAAGIFLILRNNGAGAVPTPTAEAAATETAAAEVAAQPAAAQSAAAVAGAATAEAASTLPQAPTAATLAGSAAAPAFRYSFDDGDAAGWTGDPAHWTVQPDETGDFFYEGAAAPDNDTASELPNKVTMSTWRNYAVHFLMRAHQEGSNPDLPEFWLTTRAPLAEVEGCGFYNTYFDFRNQVITLAKGGGAGCEYVPIDSNGYPQLAAGEWYDVVVTMQADRMQVTVDGELLIDAEDSDVQQGYVYFNVGPGAIMQFDDVEVYKLDE